MKYLASSILALAGTVLLTSSAHGQVAATTPELILGFQATSGTGNTLNLEIDLGPATQFFGAGAFATPGEHILTILNSADLATFGSWQTTKLVSFGVIGTELSNIGTTAPDGQPKGTLYATKAESTPGVMSSPWVNNTQVAQKQAGSQIINVYNGFATGSVKSNTSSVTLSKADPNSFTSQEFAGPNGSEFFYFPVTPGIDNLIDFTGRSSSLLDGTPYITSDLWQVEPNNTTLSSVNYLGTFGLNNAGQLVFDTNAAVFAVPEPATAALLLPAVSLLGFVRRRRPAKA